MSKHLLLRLAVILLIIPYSGLTLAAYLYGSDVVYGANGKIFQYGYSMVNLTEPICNDVGCYNVCEGSYGCMTLQYGDALNGRKASRCPSCINSGCCNCRSCCATRGCTRE